MTFDLKDFEKSTALFFGTPEGKAYLRMLKLHPSIRYYGAAALDGKGQDNGCAFFDGVKHPIRIIDQILDNSK